MQKQLYKIYLRILSLDSTKERDVALEILLWKFYKDEKGAFKVTQLGRFTRNGRWIIQELNMFLQLNHIFNSVKNPQERIVRLKQFKLSAIIAEQAARAPGQSSPTVYFSLFLPFSPSLFVGLYLSSLSLSLSLSLSFSILYFFVFLDLELLEHLGHDLYIKSTVCSPHR